MMLELSRWNTSWLGVSWDTINGRARLRLRKPKDSRGSAYRDHGGWYALWRGESEWVWQHGTRQWLLPTIQTALSEAGRKRVFQLLSNDKVLYEHVYIPKSRGLLRRLDPTYDMMDEEEDDFFVWTSRMVERQSADSNYVDAAR